MYTHIPDGDVENVGADGGGDGHVAFALFGHQNTGNEIGHGGTGRQEGEPHYHVGNFEAFAGDGSPPDHQVGVDRDP